MINVALFVVFALLCSPQMLPCKKITPFSKKIHTTFKKNAKKLLRDPLEHNNQLRFVFIVPSYNNAQWYQKNILSMLEQNYTNYHIIYIDDASTDNTATLVEELIAEHKSQDKVTLIKNTTRQGMMANRYKAIFLCQKDDICIALDGDDWLAHKDVLALYNNIYQNQSIWITYGSYLSYPSNKQGPFCKAIPRKVLQKNAIRSYKWSSSHLKTFRSWLFQLIKIEDLMMNGTFLEAATDLAIMLPMIEMAQFHSFFVAEHTCYYNTANQLNIAKQKSSVQTACSKHIRHQTPYQPIKKCL